MLDTKSERGRDQPPERRVEIKVEHKPVNRIYCVFSIFLRCCLSPPSHPHPLIDLSIDLSIHPSIEPRPGSYSHLAISSNNTITIASLDPHQQHRHHRIESTCNFVCNVAWPWPCSTAAFARCGWIPRVWRPLPRPSHVCERSPLPLLADHTTVDLTR